MILGKIKPLLTIDGKGAQSTVMKYTIYGVWAFVLLSIVGMLVVFGLKPRPIKKVRPSFFYESSQIAPAVYARLRQEMQKVDVVVLGYDPKQGVFKEFAQTLAQAAAEDQVALRTIEVWGHLNLGVEAFAKEIDMVKSFQDLTTEIESDSLVVLIVPQEFSTHFMEEGFIQKLRAQLPNKKILGLTLSLVAGQKGQEAQMGYQCESTKKKPGLGTLHCVSLSESKILAAQAEKKKFPKDTFFTSVSQFGLLDYITFISLPSL